MTIYTSCVRLHLGYVEIIYDNPYNELFKQNIGKVQYNTHPGITGAMRKNFKRRSTEKTWIWVVKWDKKVL